MVWNLRPLRADLNLRERKKSVVPNEGSTPVVEQQVSAFFNSRGMSEGWERTLS